MFFASRDDDATRRGDGNEATADQLEGLSIKELEGIAAAGGVDLTGGEANEVTDTEDEDQELTPPGASANDREEQPEAPNVQSQGQTLGEHDHEVEASRRELAEMARFDRQSKVEGENEDDGHRIQYTIVKSFCGVLSEKFYKQKVYKTEEKARASWNNKWSWCSSVMFKLWVGRSGLVCYETEDSYGTVAATKDIKDAFEKDPTVGLDVNHSNVKWTRCADVGTVIGAVIGAVAGAYFLYKGGNAVATAVTEKTLSELYSDVPDEVKEGSKLVHLRGTTGMDEKATRNFQRERTCVECGHTVDSHPKRNELGFGNRMVAAHCYELGHEGKCFLITTCSPCNSNGQDRNGQKSDRAFKCLRNAHIEYLRDSDGSHKGKWEYSHSVDPTPKARLYTRQAQALLQKVL